MEKCKYAISLECCFDKPLGFFLKNLYFFNYISFSLSVLIIIKQQRFAFLNQIRLYFTSKIRHASNYLKLRLKSNYEVILIDNQEPI